MAAGTLKGETQVDAHRPAPGQPVTIEAILAADHTGRATGGRWRRRLAETLFSVAFAALLLAPQGAEHALSSPAALVASAGERIGGFYRNTVDFLGEARLAYTLASGQPLILAAVAPQDAAGDGFVADEPAPPATLVCEQTEHPAPTSEQRFAPPTAVEPQAVVVAVSAPPVELRILHVPSPETLRAKLTELEGEFTARLQHTIASGDAVRAAAEAARFEHRARAVVLRMVHSAGAVAPPGEDFNPGEESSSRQRTAPHFFRWNAKARSRG